jgi:hypothetical protein
MLRPSLPLLACLLTGCGGWTVSADPPPSAVQPCARPVPLGDQALSDQRIEILWGRDRAALLTCGDKVEVLAGRAPATNPQ